MAAHSRIMHGVAAGSLLTLKPQKLGRHHHRVPQHIREMIHKHPRMICDYFLASYRINLEFLGVTVSENPQHVPDCTFESPLGRIGFAIDRALLNETLECYYGSSAPPARDDQPESSSEKRMRTRLGQDLSEIFGSLMLAGGSLGKLKPHTDAYDEPEWEYQVEVDCSSHITNRQSSLCFLLDQDMADHLVNRLSIPGGERSPIDPRHNVPRLRVQLNCVLAQLQLPLADVLGLQPGDILMTRLNERCDVLIDDQKLFRGAIYDDDGSLCLTSLESVTTP